MDLDLSLFVYALLILEVFVVCLLALGRKKDKEEERLLDALLCVIFG